MAGSVLLGLCLVFTLVAGVLAFGQIQTLQTTGESQPGAVGTFFSTLTPLSIILLGALAFLGLTAFVIAMLKGFR